MSSDTAQAYKIYKEIYPDIEPNAKQLMHFGKKRGLKVTFKTSNGYLKSIKDGTNVPDFVVDNILNEIHSNEENEEKKKNEPTVYIPKKLTYEEQQILGKKISQLFEFGGTEGEKEILQMIATNKFNVDLDYDFIGKHIWIPACESGKSTVVKALVNLRPDIMDYEHRYSASSTYSGLDLARQRSHFDIVEILILEKLGAGKANQIINDCNDMFNEDGIINGFCNELNTMENSVLIQKGLVSIITNNIKKRNPISSFLTNLSMKLDPDSTWKCISNVSNSIIKNTNDKVGWHYLNNFISTNNSFIYRKYALNDDEKSVDSGGGMSMSIGGLGEVRLLQDLSAPEIVYLVTKVLKNEYNKDPQFSKFGAMAQLTDSDATKIGNLIISEQINGKNFKAMTKNDAKGLLGDLGPMKQVMFSTFLFGTTARGANIAGIISQMPIIPIAMVPKMKEGEFAFDRLVKMCLLEASNAANEDIKEFFEKEEKDNPNDWKFLVEYGHNFGDGKRLRQDTSLKYGVQSEYSKKDMIKMMGCTSFNPIRYYDFEIYLNKLMFRNGFLNDSFQTDCREFFSNKQGVDYRKGPLKKIKRCKIKTETDYGREEFPTSACLLDIIRCTITFDSISRMIKYIKLFEQHISNGNGGSIREIMRIKNGFTEYDHNKPNYTDVKFNVQVYVNNQEVIGEIQYLLQDMAYYKIKAHKYYNIIRKDEYFNGLQSIITIKNSLEKKIGVLVANNDYKGLMAVIVNENVKNYNDLIKLNGFTDWMRQIYKSGNLKCLQAIVAVIEDKNDMMKFIKIKYDEPMGGRHEAKGTGFEILCSFGRVHAIKYMFKKMINDEVNKQSMILESFIIACKWGNIEAVIYLYNECKEKDKLDMTKALDVACKNGTANSGEFLLNNLKDNKEKIKYIRDNFNDVVANFFGWGSQQDIVELFLNSIKDDIKLIIDLVSKMNDKKQNCFYIAMYNNRIDQARLMLSYINNDNYYKEKWDIINAKNGDEELTPLLYAAGNWKLDNIKYLLSLARDDNDKIQMIEIKNKNGKNSFEVACENKDKQSVQFILTQVKDENKKKKMMEFEKSCGI